MKILHVVNSLCVGGIENSVIALCNLMSAVHDIHLLVLTDSDQDFLSRVSDRVSVKILPVKRYRPMLLNIAALTIRIPLLVSYIRSISPQIIHTHVYQYNIMPFLIAMNQLGISFQHFHTIHTTGLHYSSTSFAAKQKIRVERCGYSSFHTNLVCVSRETKRIVLRLFDGSYTRVEVLENGVDNTEFDPACFGEKAHDTFRLIYTSRLVAGKNHETLLRALALVRTKYHNVELWLVGDGELAVSLRELALQLNVVDAVEFLGRRSDISQLLNQCDLAVFPSEYEGFSVALVEMIMMGLPVICSDIQNFRDLFSEDDALFFSVHDPVQLADRIERVYSDRMLLAEYSRRSLLLAEKYTLSGQCDKLLTYYQSSLQ